MLLIPLFRLLTVDFNYFNFLPVFFLYAAVCKVFF